MSDLILKEIYIIYETKDLTKEQIKKIQNDWKRNFWKYDNLSGDELNTKSNKNVYRNASNKRPPPFLGDFSINAPLKIQKI